MQDQWFKIRKEGLDMLDGSDQGRGMGISPDGTRPHVAAGVTGVILAMNKLVIQVDQSKQHSWSHKLAGVFIANDIAFKMLPESQVKGQATFEVTGNTHQLKEAWKRLISHLDYFERGGQKG